MVITVLFFAIAFLLLGMHQSSPTGHPVLLRYPVGLGTSEGLGTQSDWDPVMSGTGASLPPVSLRGEYF